MLPAPAAHKGSLPLLDVVLEQPGGEHFVELALERTDARVRAGKTISPSFLFAALLWQQVEVRWKQLRAQGEHTIPALSQAADSVLDEQTGWPSSAASSDMREIWFMQPRFERRMGKTIYRMIEQPRFRAACDFLQLRAAGESRQRAGAMVDGPGQCRRRPARRNDRGSRACRAIPPTRRPRPRPTVAAAVPPPPRSGSASE